MAKSPERASVLGPAFIRRLARLTDVQVPPSKHALSDRLSQWVDWTRAIALSRALDGSPAAAEGPAFDSTEAAECTRVRTHLATAISTDPALASGQPASPAAGAPDDAQAAQPDYALFRRRYLDHQRAMQTATGRLRGRLRDMLAQQSAQMARLAEVDAVMELTLSPREHNLLAAVPNLLGEHFERRRQAAQPPPSDTDDPPLAAPPNGAWLDAFRREMQGVLLAELDVRFQPIEGLLAALRPR